MLKLIPFESVHAQVLVTGIMNNNILKLADKHQHLLNSLEEKNKSFTAVTDEGIVCSGGIVPVWEGVYEGWVLGSNLMNKHKLSLQELQEFKGLVEQMIQLKQPGFKVGMKVGVDHKKVMGMVGEIIKVNNKKCKVLKKHSFC